LRVAERYPLTLVYLAIVVAILIAVVIGQAVQ